MELKQQVYRCTNCVIETRINNHECNECSNQGRGARAPGDTLGCGYNLTALGSKLINLDGLQLKFSQRLFLISAICCETKQTSQKKLFWERYACSKTTSAPWKLRKLCWCTSTPHFAMETACSCQTCSTHTTSHYIRLHNNRQLFTQHSRTKKTPQNYLQQMLAIFGRNFWEHCCHGKVN